MTPEHLLLAVLGRDRPGLSASHAAETWTRTLDLAERHRLLPQLALRLRGVALSDPDRLRLLDAARDAGMRNLDLTAKLAAMCRRFDAEGIPCVPFKGPLLADRILGDLAARDCLDLDLLMSAAHLDAATAMLADLGYHAEELPAGRRSRRYHDSCYERVFVHDRHAVRAELHWRIMPPFFPFGLGIEEVIDTCQPARRAGHTFLEPPPAMLALLLIAHATRHCWSELCWLHDLACLLPTFDPREWRTLDELAARAGARRMVALGLDLLRRLPGFVAPSCALESSSKVVAALGDTIVAAWFAPDPRVLYLRRYRLFVACRERVSDRARTCWRLVVQPTPADLEWVGLPAWLDWLYPVVRPLRLLIRRLGARRMR